MNEKEWMTYRDPNRMVDHVGDTDKIRQVYKVLGGSIDGGIIFIQSRSQACDIIRCVVGNPFRTLDCLRTANPTNPHASWGGVSELSKWLSWKDGTIPNLAKKCHDGDVCNRCRGRGYESVSNEPCCTDIMDCLPCSGSGRVNRYDSVSMAVLADALEQAGCVEEALMLHLRDGKLHYPGCHAVSLFLPKEK